IEEAGQSFALTGERSRQVEPRTLQKLRHPLGVLLAVGRRSLRTDADNRVAVGGLVFATRASSLALRDSLSHVLRPGLVWYCLRLLQCCDSTLSGIVLHHHIDLADPKSSRRLR